MKSPTKGWKRVRKSARARMPDRCFGIPGRKAYVLCNRKNKLDCRGLASAFQRARQHRQHAVVKKVLRLASKTQCPWFSTGKTAQRLAKKYRIR